MILLLPAAGVIFSGADINPYLQFPPATGYVKHHYFSWPAFIIVCCVILLILFHPVRHIFRSRAEERAVRGYSFPWWGYAAICAGALFWIIAWTRPPLLHDIQRWTFVPLWISYIVTVNAICIRRSGRSLLTQKTGYMMLLFPASAAFWWLFEYLNRFTSNWYYTGVTELSPSGYFLEATLAFSTVLPGVMSTGELVKTFPRLYAGMDSYLVVRFSRGSALVLLAASGSALFLIPLFPQVLFPMLWISPALIIISLQSVAGDESIMRPLESGDWRAVIIYAVAALVCGFFWEMWNIWSQAKWIYSIPYVQGFHIFEMPLPGYTGYLPFGIECAVAAGIFSRRGEEPWMFR